MTPRPPSRQRTVQQSSVASYITQNHAVAEWLCDVDAPNLCRALPPPKNMPTSRLQLSVGRVGVDRVSPTLGGVWRDRVSKTEPEPEGILTQTLAVDPSPRRCVCSSSWWRSSCDCLHNDLLTVTAWWPALSLTGQFVELGSDFRSEKGCGQIDPSCVALPQWS